MRATVKLDYLELEIMARTKTLPEICNEVSAFAKKAGSLGGAATYAEVTITDLYGRPAFTALFSGHTIGLWFSITRTAFKTLSRVPTSKEINEWSNLHYEGNGYCAACDKWYNRSEMHTFSFAGIVCAKCYDPKKHTPADTRGD